METYHRYDITDRYGSYDNRIYLVVSLVTKFNLITRVFQALLDAFTHEAELLKQAFPRWSMGTREFTEFWNFQNNGNGEISEFAPLSILILQILEF